MLTPEQENYISALYDKHQAEVAITQAETDYTNFRAALDDAKDPAMLQKSQPYEDNIKQLRADLQKKISILNNIVAS